MLSVVGLAMGAATLTTTTGGGGSGRFLQIQQPGSIDPGPKSPPNGMPPDPPNLPGPPGIDITLLTCIGFLSSLFGMALTVLALAIFVGAIYYRYNVWLALLSGWTIGPPVVLVYALLTNCMSSDVNGPGGPKIPDIGDGPSGLGIGQTPVSIEHVPSWVLDVVLGGVLVGAVGLLAVSRDGDEDVTTEEATITADKDEDETNDLDEIARAARRGAERIEAHNADVNNAVYRAWLDMTRTLDVDDPETHSAGEFADEAIRMGMAENDVEELTELFNEMRYGGKDAATREAQAVAVLRNIEEQYGQRLDTDSTATNSDPSDE